VTKRGTGATAACHGPRPRCYLFSRDLGRVWRVGEALEFGVVGINTGVISYEGAPFGGVKESGLGREGPRHGLDDYLELKYLCFEGLG
jgi:succinate-semialdehyde dehydrogenase / glutarate-semialdehyde dehydrogenase